LEINGKSVTESHNLFCLLGGPRKIILVFAMKFTEIPNAYAMLISVTLFAFSLHYAAILMPRLEHYVNTADFPRDKYHYLHPKAGRVWCENAFETAMIGHAILYIHPHCKIEVYRSGYECSNKQISK
jgi:hypothetical protein